MAVEWESTYLKNRKKREYFQKMIVNAEFIFLVWTKPKQCKKKKQLLKLGEKQNHQDCGKRKIKNWKKSKLNRCNFKINGTRLLHIFRL